MKPTPLSALLADDLLLDQVGARLDTDDDLGSLLLAVAHQADTPIPRAAPTRRRRPHRGLTVLAALGVAVSGATVAAAVELAPLPSDQASSTPHLRGVLPRSLQALVLPFLAGTPFQSHLVLPVSGRLADPFAAPLTAEGLLAADPSSVYPMGDPIVGVTTSSEESQDPAREKAQGKGTPNGGTTLTDPSESGSDADDQGGDTDGDQDGATGADQPQPAESTPQPKPTKTPTPPPATTIPTPTITPIPTPVTTDPPDGQSTGHNGQGTGRGPGGSGDDDSGTTGTGGTSTTGGTTTGTTTSGTLADAAAERDDPASRVPPKGRNNVRVVSQPPVTGVAPSLTTTGMTTGLTDPGTTPSSTATSPAVP